MFQGEKTYLISVPGTLVVVGEWNDRGAHAQNHGGMNFAMSVCGTVCVLFLLSQIIGRHGDHHSLFFQGVDVLDDSGRYQYLPPIVIVFSFL